MVKKNEQQSDDGKNKPENELITMMEMRHIFDTVLPMLKTDTYYSSKLPERETKYGMLGGKGCQGTHFYDLHLRFDGKNCFPFEKPKVKSLQLRQR